MSEPLSFRTVYEAAQLTSLPAPQRVDLAGGCGLILYNRSPWWLLVAGRGGTGGQGLVIVPSWCEAQIPVEGQAQVFVRGYTSAAYPQGVEDYDVPSLVHGVWAVVTASPVAAAIRPIITGEVALGASGGASARIQEFVDTTGTTRQVNGFSVFNGKYNFGTYYSPYALPIMGMGLPFFGAFQSGALFTADVGIDPGNSAVFHLPTTTLTAGSATSIATPGYTATLTNTYVLPGNTSLNPNWRYYVRGGQVSMSAATAANLIVYFSKTSDAGATSPGSVCGSANLGPFVADIQPRTQADYVVGADILKVANTAADFFYLNLLSSGTPSVSGVFNMSAEGH